eukprot:3651613-Alexandrium_andersonii.AAC.1
MADSESGYPPLMTHVDRNFPRTAPHARWSPVDQARRGPPALLQYGRPPEVRLAHELRRPPVEHQWARQRPPHP